MNKLRLIVTDKCPKSCENCCNNHKAAQKRSPWYSFKDAAHSHFVKKITEVNITGGEPMLFPKKVKHRKWQIGRMSEAKRQRPDTRGITVSYGEYGLKDVYVGVPADT